MKMEKTKLSEKKTRSASALILAVVLTSLLAIIGTVFLMVARVDKIATSAITENKELQFALESIVAEISQQLALDVPHSDPNRPPQEYYDYPDPCNAFLAALEPYQSGTDYFWRQVSDVTDYIRDRGWDASNIPTVIISDHNGIYLNIDGSLRKQRADADGDGVSDSIWIKLNDNTSRGKPVFAAVRVIDNGGMLNVNTAYKFDPAEPIGRINGSSQTQINLAALSQRGANGTLGAAADKLQAWRCGAEPNDLLFYEQNVIWQYNKPLGAYTPFDMSDELELRNRFILEFEHIDTRIEEEVWDDVFTGNNYLHVPVGQSSSIDDWFTKAYFDDSDPNNTENYSYRHIATTYNIDRIINPVGGKMFNINLAPLIHKNDPNGNVVRLLMRAALLNGRPLSDWPAADGLSAQITANLIDYCDDDVDNEVTAIYDDAWVLYYGFEAQPFISEIGIKIDPNDSANNHFAVELYNPFNIPIPLDDFKLSLYDGTNLITDIPLSGAITIGPNDFLVVVDDSTVFNPPNWYEDPNLKLSGDYNDTSVPPDGTFEDWDNYDIALKRYIPETGTEIYLDNQPTQNSWFAQGTVKYVQRDSTNWHIVYEDVNDSDSNPDTLGFTNDYRTNATNYNLALANHDFITIGDIVLPLKIGPNTTPYGTIGRKLSSLPPPEDRIRINLADPAYQQIFNYLTVMDPNELQYGGHPATETRVKGRININTAPWFVIAQLPWVRPQLAQKIVEYRDTIAKAAFESIGELNNVINDTDPCLVNYINYYARDFDPNGLLDQLWFPDLTPGDGVPDDFEERNLIFSRISNLVTVRSDVFTAYILVRIGADGPQKRAIAILDRSEVSDISGRVKLIALHPVPDPR